MADTGEHTNHAHSVPSPDSAPATATPIALDPLVAVAAIASGAAGLIHAVAVGIHADAAALSRIFVALAIMQCSVAVLVVIRNSRLSMLAAVAVNLAAAVGWLVTRFAGISWINGLQIAERPQFADTVAAGLAAAATVAALASRRNWRPARRVWVVAPALLAAVLAIPAMVTASTHDHDHDSAATDHADDHTNDHADAVTDTDQVAVATESSTDDSTTEHAEDHADDHTDDHAASLVDPVTTDASTTDGNTTDDSATDHAEAGHSQAAPPTPYDPTMPIDLSGVDGVTPQQQAFAENLVAATIRDLPQWADLDAVEAAGFHSIGDAGTGHEHYIQWDWIDDDVVLDPDFPESLVFEPQPDGSKKLVSAMFMLPPSISLEDAPNPGGSLMQWHVHGDLCFTDDPVAPLVAGLKPIGTDCRAPLVNGTLAPMVHVWIRPHECGPFAALDGIGAGQVAADESEWCDTAHGAH